MAASPPLGTRRAAANALVRRGQRCSARKQCSSATPRRNTIGSSVFTQHIRVPQLTGTLKLQDWTLTDECVGS